MHLQLHIANNTTTSPSGVDTTAVTPMLYFWGKVLNINNRHINSYRTFEVATNLIKHTCIVRRALILPPHSYSFYRGYSHSTDRLARPSVRINLNSNYSESYHSLLSPSYPTYSSSAPLIWKRMQERSVLDNTQLS